jgi:tryptophan synthase alpha chain
MGLDAFCDEAAEAGIGGLLVSDLPPEEVPELGEKLQARDIDRIVLVAPTTECSRIGLLVGGASGYVYLITRTGVTGAGGSFSDRLGEQVSRIRARSPLRIVAGFGIRDVADVKVVKPIVDGVVIGARLLEVVGDAAAAGGVVGGAKRIAAAVREFIGPIREALGH